MEIWTAGKRLRGRKEMGKVIEFDRNHERAGRKWEGREEERTNIEIHRDGERRYERKGRDRGEG